MRSRPNSLRWVIHTVILGTLSRIALAGDVLRTSGFTSCVDNAKITVTALDIQFDRSTKQITFDVGGTSAEAQNVTASLIVTAYGNQVYQKDFDPCDDHTKVIELCPGKHWHRKCLSGL